MNPTNLFRGIAFVCLCCLPSPASAQEQADEGPARKVDITVGREVAAFDGPLRDDGTINYIAALNRQASEGVTQENNAFRDLLQLYVQGDIGDEWIHGDEEASGAMRRLGLELGLAPNDLARGPKLQSETFFLIGLGHSEREADAILEPYWDGLPQKLHPDYIKWIASMEPVFKHAVTALDKEAYWVPLVARDDEALLASAPLPQLACHRVLARGLRARACHAAATGDHARAIASIRALRRLAYFIRDKQASLLSGYVGISIEMIAVDALRAVIAKRSMLSKELADLAAAWASVPSPKPLAALIQGGECVVTLDAFMQITARRVEDSDLATAYKLFDHGDLDVNRGLEQIHSWYEAHAKTGEAGSFKEREQRLAAFNEAFEQYLLDSYEQYFQEIGGVPQPSPDALANRQSRTDAFVSMFLAVWFPALGAENRVETQLIAKQRCGLAAIAIERYRMEHGTLPDDLHALVPDYLDAVPRDPYDNQSLRYKQADGGYVLYAVGENLRDDKGLEDRQEGDVVIEIRPEAVRQE